MSPAYGSVVAIASMPGEYLTVSTTDSRGQISVRRIERWSEDGYPETRGILTPYLESVSLVDKEVPLDFLNGSRRS